MTVQLVEYSEYNCTGKYTTGSVITTATGGVMAYISIMCSDQSPEHLHNGGAAQGKFGLIVGQHLNSV